MIITKIGFTGTQKGMTPEQQNQLYSVLRAFRHIAREAKVETALEFHHGDCVGADSQAHDMAWRLEFIVHLHPPVDGSKRAWCKAPVVHKSKTYLARNRDIVKRAEVLIATPGGRFEEVRSGTWSTVRFALRQGTPIIVVWPDGSKETWQEKAKARGARDEAKTAT